MPFTPPAPIRRRPESSSEATTARGSRPDAGIPRQRVTVRGSGELRFSQDFDTQRISHGLVQCIFEGARYWLVCRQSISNELESYPSFLLDIAVDRPSCARASGRADSRASSNGQPRPLGQSAGSKHGNDPSHA
jgi:hypothetical protein